MFPPGISLELCSQAQREMRSKAEWLWCPKDFKEGAAKQEGQILRVDKLGINVGGYSQDSSEVSSGQIQDFRII